MRPQRPRRRCQWPTRPLPRLKRRRFAHQPLAKALRRRGTLTRRLAPPCARGRRTPMQRTRRRRRRMMSALGRKTRAMCPSLLAAATQAAQAQMPRCLPMPTTRARRPLSGFRTRISRHGCRCAASRARIADRVRATRRRRGCRKRCRFPRCAPLAAHARAPLARAGRGGPADALSAFLAAGLRALYPAMRAHAPPQRLSSRHAALTTRRALLLRSTRALTWTWQRLTAPRQRPQTVALLARERLRYLRRRF